jgi:hypothetical protein
MKNAVFWDINPQFIPHRKHITSLLQSTAGYCYVRFEVCTAVTMKNAVFWDMKTEFVSDRRHITSPLQSPAGYCYVRFEVFTAVTEECRLLGYKNPVRTSRETHYFSAIEPQPVNAM